MQDEKIPWVALLAIGIIFGAVKCHKSKKAAEAAVTRMIYVQEYIFPRM